MEKPNSLHITARRWYQRTYGNTYHSVTIYLNDNPAVHIPFAYGYGEQWLQTAVDWLQKNGYPDAQYGTRYLREVLGGTYSVTDVSRKKDL